MAHPLYSAQGPLDAVFGMHYGGQAGFCPAGQNSAPTEQGQKPQLQGAPGGFSRLHALQWSKNGCGNLAKVSTGNQKRHPLASFQASEKTAQWELQARQKEGPAKQLHQAAKPKPTTSLAKQPSWIPWQTHTFFSKTVTYIEPAALELHGIPAQSAIA